MIVCRQSPWSECNSTKPSERQVTTNTNCRSRKRRIEARFTVYHLRYSLSTNHLQTLAAIRCFCSPEVTRFGATSESGFQIHWLQLSHSLTPTRSYTAPKNVSCRKASKFLVGYRNVDLKHSP